MNPAIIIIIAFPVVFIGLWLFITFILSKIGWARLLPHYEYGKKPFDGENLGSAGGRINGVNYNGVLELKADYSGLHIQPVKIFKAFHSPVLIPWQDIKIGKRSGLLGFFSTEAKVVKNGKRMVNLRLNDGQIRKLNTYLKS